MNLLIIMLFILAVLCFLFFTIMVRVNFLFDSDIENMSLTLFWLYPLIKAIISIENTKPILTVYLFKGEIYRRQLKSRKNSKTFNGFKQIQSIKARKINVDINYGFKDPFLTGITCGAINVASQYINIETINNCPDFLTDVDFLKIHGSAKLNFGSELINFYKRSISKK